MNIQLKIDNYIKMKRFDIKRNIDNIYKKLPFLFREKIYKIQFNRPNPENKPSIVYIYKVKAYTWIQAIKRVYEFKEKNPSDFDFSHDKYIIEKIVEYKFKQNKHKFK